MDQQSGFGAVFSMNQTLTSIEVKNIREDFPILSRRVHGHRLAYLDNAATTLKPQSVVECVSQHYLMGAANIHRGVHHLSEVATEQYETTRQVVRDLINARDTREIIFTSGTTGSINLIAHSFGSLLNPGDEILISAMEHHSNIVPWQLLKNRKGITIKVIPINDYGEINLKDVESLISPKTKLVSIVSISNSLGTINPIKEIIALAHRYGAKVLVDGAQEIAHSQVDVQKLDVDFYAFSGHKLYGPTGVGVLYGKRDLLELMPPFFGGGDMIRSVSFEETTFADLPGKFEAGTPAIASVIGLGAAISYIKGIGIAKIRSYEDQLLHLLMEKLRTHENIKFIGEAKNKSGIVGFTMGDIHPHDIGTIVDRKGVAIRVGHHCTQPVMKRFGVPATARASLAMYNTPEDIDQLSESLKEVARVFQ